jgi:uncharacterized protein (TIGR02594 family)
MSNISTIIKTDRDTLKLGMSGENVKLAQLALAEKGYNLKGTGYFGNATDTAVEAVQRKLGLKVDGQFGPLTAKGVDKLPSAGLLPTLEHMEISRPLWLEAGIKLIGVKEGAGSKDNSLIIDWAEEEGGSIAEQFNHDSIPWCALFANHILTKVGLKGTETLWALDFAGKWPAIRLAGPAVGAFAPMKRKPSGGHIMVVVGKDQNGNIMGLGGNQKDAVTIEPFNIGRLDQGFWWPIGSTPPQYVGLKSLPIVKSNGKVSTNEA